MGNKKTEVKSTVGAASGEEMALRRLLASVAGDAAGQLGDLSGIASGKGLQLTPEDIALIEKAVGGTTDSAIRSLQGDFTKQNAALEGNLAATGQKDSSIELVKRIMQGGEQATALANVRSEGAARKAQYGMALPFQRAAAMSTANSDILARLGVANPALQAFLQERLANTTQEQTQSGFSFADLAPMFSISNK